MPPPDRRTSSSVLPAVLLRTYARFLKIRGQPRQIALGFALGVFLAFTPTMGFQTVAAIFLASLLGWNKLAAAIGVWITNPLTAPLFYGSSYVVGARVLGRPARDDWPPQLSLNGLFKSLAEAPDILWVLTVGGVLLGLPAAVMSYYLALGAVRRYRARRRRPRGRSRRRK